MVLVTIIPNYLRSRAGGFDFIRCESCGKDNRVELKHNGGGAAFMCQRCDTHIELNEVASSPIEMYSDSFNVNPDTRF